MTRRRAWLVVFWSVTALALGMEVWAAFDDAAWTDTWTDVIVRYVPEDLLLGLLAGGFVWLALHFWRRYRRR